MKKIKDLTVKVTYTVGLCNLNVPDEVYNALAECYDNGGEVPMPDDCIIDNCPELACASEWLTDNINESDAMDWEFEIEDLQDEDE